MNSRDYPSADIGPDHQLLIANIRLKLKARRRHTVSKRYDTQKLSDSLVANDYQAQQQQQPFNGRLSGTTRVGRYQKKHSPAHTHPGQRTSFVIFLHLQRSTASSLFSLRA